MSRSGESSLRVRIVVDSTCDLPKELIARHQLEVVPVYLNLGGQEVRDGVELARRDFYHHLPSYAQPPTTAAPSPDRFRQVYQKLAAAGAEIILSIHVSSALSATVEMARQAAAEFTGAEVTVFDGGQVSLGTGMLAQTAAQAIEEGLEFGEVLDLLRDQARRTFVFAALDTLEYLRRSGRVSALVAGVGGLLRVKPILKMNQGQATSERVRTNRRAFERLHALTAQASPIERAALVHSNAPAVAEELRKRLAPLLPPGPISSVMVTPIIGAHIGPNAAGIALIGQHSLSEDAIKEIMR